MGILNVTPDSYFDGGKFLTEKAILERAQEILSQGGDIIDIGGESTGPGSPDVATEEERNRVLPAVRIIHEHFPQTLISVDTYKADVAEQAVLAGAQMINDVTAGRGDTAMFSVIAKYRIPYVMMFSKDSTARTTKQDVQYDDVLATVLSFLQERMRMAESAGIEKTQIILDPGLGHFISADPQYSWHILHHLETFTAVAPVLVSPSRKSFLAGPKNLPPSERLPATLEATILALQHGARIIRTHDVGETKRVLGSTKTPSTRIAQAQG